MPELPEVETIAQDLNKYLTNKTISKLEYISLGKMLHNKQSFFTRHILRKKVKRVFRRAKMPIIELESGFIVFHLKMTGQLIYRAKKLIVAGGHPIVSTGVTVPNKFTRLVIHFKEGGSPRGEAGILYFNDIRKFGWVEYMNQDAFKKVSAKVGLEPLDKKLNLAVFIKLIAKRWRTSIKATLLDQKLVAGLGNIYVDEVLFKAKVRPTRLVNTLSKQEFAKIFSAIPLILKKAILHRGTTFSNYTDSDGLKGNFVKHLKVYGRAGKNCLVCHKPLIKTRVAGRGTHYCANCQS